MKRCDLVKAAGAPGLGAMSPAAVTQYIASHDQNVIGAPLQFSYLVLDIETESV